METEGVIYVLSNPAMPGLVKLGKTTNADPAVRMDQLYTTGVPVPFKLEMAYRVKDVTATEQALHKAFVNDRVNPRREFFELEPCDIKDLLGVLGTEVESNVSESLLVTNNEVRNDSSITEVRKRRPKLRFDALGINIGSSLTNKQTDCVLTVASPKSVLLHSKEMSLSRADQEIFQSKFQRQASQWWYYQDQRLKTIYDRIYEVE